MVPSVSKYREAEDWKDFNIKHLCDMDMDGQVNVADVTELANYMLGQGTYTDVQKAMFDVNENGSTNVNDVTELVNVLLGTADNNDLP